MWEPSRQAGRFRADGQIGTAFHERTASLCQSGWYFNWDLSHLVAVFEDPYKELAAIRHSVGAGDQSPLTKCAISGPDAAEFVDWMFPKDMTRLAVGSIVFTILCNHQGKLITDGLLFRSGETAYRFTGDPCVEWFRSNAERFDVEIADVTADWGILAIQGPNARSVIEKVTGEDWADLDFSRLRPSVVAGADVEVARQGFTGELGYEFLTPAGSGNIVWDEVLSAGEEFGIRACGHMAIDIARVEAGLLIPGPDYANAGPDPAGSHVPWADDPALLSSPYQLGLGRLVSLEKNNFVGRDALIAEKEGAGPSTVLVGVEIDWQELVGQYLEHSTAPNFGAVDWVPKPISAGGRTVGRATSVVWSPTTRGLIGFGHVPRELREPGTPISVRWQLPGVEAPVEAAAEVGKLPFLRLNRV